MWNLPEIKPPPQCMWPRASAAGRSPRCWQRQRTWGFPSKRPTPASWTICATAPTIRGEFQKGAGNAFTGGGSAAYQPRDANTGKPGQNMGRKKQTEKSMQAQQETFGQKVQKSEKSQPGENSTFTENKSMDFQKEDTGQHKSNHVSKARAKKQMYQPASGQKVQKSDVKPGQEEKPDFVKESNTFTGQENFSQPEETEKKQADTEDYHRRDTYRQSQKKGKYHKKRVRKEHRVKGGSGEKPENRTFTEETFAGNTGNSFQGEGGSEFTGSKKLQKKQRQAEKAGKKVQKARAKLPKTREYTLQRDRKSTRLNSSHQD